jgi:hypothetical protein
LLVCVSTHEPAQMVEPGRHVDEHRPAEHACPPVHVTPQPPQFCGSPMVEMQWPLQND